MSEARKQVQPESPTGLGRWLWYNVKPMPPDEWREQVSSDWLKAEAIQGAFLKGFEDEADEHFQREWEKRKVKDGEAESLKRAREK